MARSFTLTHATRRNSPSVTTSPASYKAFKTFDGRSSRSSSAVRGLWACSSNPYWNDRSTPANSTRRDPPPRLLLPPPMRPKTPTTLTEVALGANVLGCGLVPRLLDGTIDYLNLPYASRFTPSDYFSRLVQHLRDLQRSLHANLWPSPVNQHWHDRSPILMSHALSDYFSYLLPHLWYLHRSLQQQPL